LIVTTLALSPIECGAPEAFVAAMLKVADALPSFRSVIVFDLL
jgi:hypothetical protein